MIISTTKMNRSDFCVIFTIPLDSGKLTLRLQGVRIDQQYVDDMVTMALAVKNQQRKYHDKTMSAFT